MWLLTPKADWPGTASGADWMACAGSKAAISKRPRIMTLTRRRIATPFYYRSWHEGLKLRVQAACGLKLAARGQGSFRYQCRWSSMFAFANYHIFAPRLEQQRRLGPRRVAVDSNLCRAAHRPQDRADRPAGLDAIGLVRGVERQL